MFGLRLNWKCKSCLANMHNDISFTNIYEINGESAYIKVKCNDCGKIHFINTVGGEVIEFNDDMNVKQIGTCTF